MRDVFFKEKINHQVFDLSFFGGVGFFGGWLVFWGLMLPIKPHFRSINQPLGVQLHVPQGPRRPHMAYGNRNRTKGT